MPINIVGIKKKLQDVLSNVQSNLSQPRQVTRTQPLITPQQVQNTFSPQNIQRGFSNLSGNIQNITNPQTRGTFFKSFQPTPPPQIQPFVSNFNQNLNHLTNPNTRKPFLESLRPAQGILSSGFGDRLKREVSQPMTSEELGLLNRNKQVSYPNLAEVSSGKREGKNPRLAILQQRFNESKPLGFELGKIGELMGNTPEYRKRMEELMSKREKNIPLTDKDKAFMREQYVNQAMSFVTAGSSQSTKLADKFIKTNKGKLFQKLVGAGKVDEAMALVEKMRNKPLQKALQEHIGNYVLKSESPVQQVQDFYNQAKGGKIPINASLSQTKQGLQKPIQESLGGSVGGGGGISSPKGNIKIANPQDPYFNVQRLNVGGKTQQAVKQAVEEVKPQIEAVVGRKLGNKEVVDFANQSARVLDKTVGREQTKQWTSAMLKARQQLAKQAQEDTLSPEFLDTLIQVKSQGSDIARKLQSLSIGADPKTVTAKQAILEAILKVTDDSGKILEAAKGVNFNDQNQATAFYRQFVKPSAEDWITLVRYNSMLSSPNTHIINASSNFQGTGIVAPIEKTILGGIDWLRATATGGERKYFAGEGVEYAKGYYSNLKNAADNFTRVMRGESLSGNPDLRYIPLTAKGGVTGATEKTLNYPMRLLEGMDQFFTTLTSGGVEKSLAYRQGKGVNVGNIPIKAGQEAAERLFRGELNTAKQGTLLNAVDNVTNLVFRARSNENPIVRTIATFTFPFVKTPMNIAKQMIEYSPAGVLTLPGSSVKQEQLVKAIMGSSVALGASMLLSSDRLTWGTPTSEKQRDAFYAAGMQPYALKVGDKWVSYAKLHPVIGFNLALVAAVYDAQKKKRLDDGQVETVLSGVSKWWGFFADQSYIKNMGDLVASARGDLTGPARLVSNYPTQLIPFRALLSWVERLVDPYQRRIDPDGSILEKQLQAIGSQLPGIAGNVPTRNNIYGEPLKMQNPLINAFSPARVTTENSDEKGYYDAIVNSSAENRLKEDLKKDLLKGKGIEETGKTRDNYIRYLDENGEAQLLDVTKFTGEPPSDPIQKAKWESEKASMGNRIYFSEATPEQKKKAISAMGMSYNETEFRAIKSLNDEQQAPIMHQLLEERQWSPAKMDAFIDREVLTSNVVEKMADQGLITREEGKTLKDYIKDRQVKTGKADAGKGKKLKVASPPKLNAPKVSVRKTSLKAPKIGKLSVKGGTVKSVKLKAPELKKAQIKKNDEYKVRPIKVKLS